MAQFEAKPFNLYDINGGERYQNGDIPDAEAINKPIEAAALAQLLARNQPDVSEANTIGDASVEIVGSGNETKFKFKSIKGNDGVSAIIRGVVTNSENLPSPISLNDMKIGYLVGSSEGNYHLYVQVGEKPESASWKDVGLFNGGTQIFEGENPKQTFDATRVVKENHYSTEGAPNTNGVLFKPVVYNTIDPLNVNAVSQTLEELVPFRYNGLLTIEMSFNGAICYAWGYSAGLYGVFYSTQYSAEGNPIFKEHNLYNGVWTHRIVRQTNKTIYPQAGTAEEMYERLPTTWSVQTNDEAVYCVTVVPESNKYTCETLWLSVINGKTSVGQLSNQTGAQIYKNYENNYISAIKCRIQKVIRMG